MTRKDYIKAVEHIGHVAYERGVDSAMLVEGVFIRFFRDDNARFDEDIFHKACSDSIQKARELRNKEKRA